jgi:hypothetical protein
MVYVGQQVDEVAVCHRWASFLHYFSLVAPLEALLSQILEMNHSSLGRLYPEGVECES